MPSLRELQLGFGHALLGGPGESAVAAIAEDGLPAPARLAIYRHHVLATLAGVLESAYPVVRRLVDARFFAYAADEFVRRHPPAGPCLVEYGAALPDFLASFPPCRHLAYLPDVARLEWAIHAAHHAPDAVPLAPTALGDIDPARVGDLVLRFDPSVALIASHWPVETIWRAHQTGGEVGRIDVAGAGEHVQVSRAGDDVHVRRLTAAAYALRESLMAGGRLADAAAAALAEDSAFDLAEALHALLQEWPLIGFTLS